MFLFCFNFILYFIFLPIVNTVAELGEVPAVNTFPFFPCLYERQYPSIGIFDNQVSRRVRDAHDAKEMQNCITGDLAYIERMPERELIEVHSDLLHFPCIFHITFTVDHRFKMQTCC